MIRNPKCEEYANSKYSISTGLKNFVTTAGQKDDKVFALIPQNELIQTPKPFKVKNEEKCKKITNHRTVS